MLNRKYLVLPLVLLLGQQPYVMGQDEFQSPTVSQIRARKLANQWHGKRVELQLIDGTRTAGELINASFTSIIISNAGKNVVVPLEQVESVVLPPGLPETMMVAITAGLGGALGYGLINLAHPDAQSWVAPTSAGIGALALGYWGLSVFFREIRYVLREEYNNG